MTNDIVIQLNAYDCERFSHKYKALGMATFPVFLFIYLFLLYNCLPTVATDKYDIHTYDHGNKMNERQT